MIRTLVRLSVVLMASLLTNAQVGAQFQMRTKESMALENSSKTKGVKDYETAVGKLTNGFTLEADASLKVEEKGIAINAGFYAIRPGHARWFDGTLVVVADKKHAPPLSVTLVQDRATGEWLATDGLLATEDGKEGLIEGHSVKIVGGEKRPVSISGNEFANCTVVVRQGKPVKEAADKSGPTPTRETSPRLDLRTWTDATGGFKTEAAFLDLKDGKIRLRKKDGNIVAVPLEKLSVTDQEWVKKSDGGTAEVAGSARDDKQRLQGAWTVESLTANGQAGKPLAEMVFTFQGDTITEHSETGTIAYDYRLDSSTKPRVITLTIPAKDNSIEGTTVLGIYVLDNDLLKLCYGSPKDRSPPKDFQAAYGSLYVLHRRKVERQRANEEKAAPGPADRPISIPPEFKDEAAKVFAEGKSYFIWSAEKTPVKSTAGLQMLELGFKFVAGDGNGQKFRTGVSVVTKDAKTGDAIEVTITTDGKSGPSGKDTAFFIVGPNRTLSGKGTARIRLLRFSENKDEKVVISNEVVVPVEF
jgi:uncharacterized protein (TIGR03067 family)